jgi:hypothetical protein
MKTKRNARGAPRREIVRLVYDPGNEFIKRGYDAHLSCGHVVFFVESQWRAGGRRKSTLCNQCLESESEQEARKAAKKEIRRYEDWIRCQIEGKARMGRS